MLLALIAVVVALGAFVSNTAVAAIIIPLITPLSSVLSVEPKVLAITVAIAVSFDFLLPIGTPPNAMAYNTGYLKIREMLKAGILLTLIAIIFLWGFMLLMK
jgi:sodium-dependent dicarboxylate transporter 2/3/5